jgi:type I restriction enzyme S subunit
MNNEANELLEKHFDLAFAAPNGVQKLRELILTFAMQGKLVPQDPNDQPASELLEEIEAEKQKLVEAGQIKQPKLVPKITFEEASYSLPKGWKWVRLGEVIVFTNGYAFKSNLFQETGIGIIKIGDISNGIVVKDRMDFVDESYLEEVDAKFQVKFNDMLIAMSGATTGKIGFNKLQEVFLLNQRVGKIEPILSDKTFLFYFLSTQIQRNLAISSGSAIPNLSTEQISEMVIPFPPIAEQRRIVAKIDRLMAQCDELENLGGDRNQKRITVHTAAINRLLAAQETSDFSTAWDFLQQHFGELYSVKENVAELRKAILQLAVMGKLVPQASVVHVASLESILAEASANGVAKGPTSDTTATEILRISAGTSQRDFYVNEDDFKHVALSTSEIQKYQLVPGDLLACRFNGNLHYVGRFSYYRGESKRIQVNPDKLIRFRIDTKFHCPRYVCYAMNAAQTREAIEAMCATTAGNIGLSAGRLKTVKIPLPPLAEQRLIVAKIDQLMTLCDRLEHQIDAATDKRTELLNALMAQV